MTLTDKLSALLAAKESLLQSATLPENLRGYSIQTRIEEADKSILELIKQIMEAPYESKTTTSGNNDDVPF